MGLKTPDGGGDQGTVVYSEHTSAHELTHVVQQSGVAKNRPIRIISPDQFRNLSGSKLRAKIDQIFHAAKVTNQVLLFDEADALFGKRGQVRDSHDRYANSEVNYLLSAAGKHRGLVFAVLCSKRSKARLRRA